MGIVNKNESDKWKNKYFSLIDENEIKQKISEDREQLLCKTIARLCLATTGFNKELDPYLKRIRNHLKKGLKSEQFKLELEDFSNALMTMDESVSPSPDTAPSLLFNFLIDHFPEQKENLQIIQKKHKQDEFPNAQYLFIAINDLIDSVQNIEPLPISSPTQNNNIDVIKLNSQLLQLLENTEIPEDFSQQVTALKEKINHSTSFIIRFDETIALLFKIKKHIQSEQQAITLFLTDLTNQLSEVKEHASEVYSTSSSKKRNILDQAVSSQIINLQESSKNADTLEPLKQLIHSRLADIQQQIQNYQTDEKIEREKAQQELKSLTNTINALQKESVFLNNKLNQARYQATRDPLTELPNRLAYDERIEIEIARSKRYNNSLSILIWDIDFFKQINDNFGHKAGDKTLVLIAKLLFQYCRESDFVSRFGGEEFTMLLSDTDAQSALKTANKLRQLIENTAFNSNGKKISITISCGITEFIKNDTADSAFIRADEALYQAKTKGRNQCIIG